MVISQDSYNEAEPASWHSAADGVEFVLEDRVTISKPETRVPFWFQSPNLDFSCAQVIPDDILDETSECSQLFRERLLRGCIIVFICAGYPGKRFIYEQAHKRGIRSIILDNPDSWARSLVESGIVSEFIPVEMSHSRIEVIRASLAALNALGNKPDGVCTFVELYVEMAANLARALDLPGPDPKWVSAARDKAHTRMLMKGAGLPGVKNISVRSESDLPIAAEYIGFPAVLKPVSGAASLGVQKVESARDLITVYRKVQDTISTLIVAAGALERKSDHQTGINAKDVIDVSVIMEEYLDGVEVDVDVLMSGGVCRYANVIDNGPTSEPFFAETWAALPSLLPTGKVDELRSLAVASVKALGFTDGVFHVELKYTSSGPRLIEVNARMGGGPTRKIHKLVSGVDLVLEQFLMAVGIPSRPPVAMRPLSRIAYAFINARRSGTVTSTDFVEQYRKRPGVVWILVYVNEGERIVGPDDGHPSWLGDIVVSHSDGQEALRVVQELEEEIARGFDARLIP